MNYKLIYQFLIVLVICIPVLSLGQNTINDKSSVKVGVSQVNITPDSPTLLSGYENRKTPFIAVHDSLYASALYFFSEKTKTLLITADLLGFPNEFANDLKKTISEKIGIPYENIMLTAVHNHGGPQIRTYNGYDYASVLKGKLIRIAIDASKKIVPMRMGIGKGSCNLNINRRALICDNTIWLGKNPDGPCDHELDVIKFEDLNKKIIAVLINWPCHGTSSGSANYQLTGDWPGAAARYIKQQVGKGIIVAVTAGASADINPIYGPGNEFCDIESVGFHVGIEAYKTLTQIESLPVKSLQVTNATMIFPGKKNNKSHLPQSTYESAPEKEIKLMVIKIGDLVLSGISGELMTEIGMEIKNQSPYSNTVIITHCNGQSGYLCTDKSFLEGGYEVMVTRFMPGVEKPLINKYIELIHSF